MCYILPSSKCQKRRRRAVMVALTTAAAVMSAVPRGCRRLVAHRVRLYWEEENVIFKLRKLGLVQINVLFFRCYHVSKRLEKLFFHLLGPDLPTMDNLRLEALPREERALTPSGDRGDVRLRGDNTATSSAATPTTRE